jgi:hypothetical protein
MLELCDESLTIDVALVQRYHTALNYGQIKVCALFLGLRILGGS